ncbi:acetyl-CoA carboxylase biotin carboxylase subunit family protein [Streptomyces sp. NRRL S-31]|uniref:ATP-grasp domain-containing protein n=1 Tax=Streptomyces sp. NRRL S-31 TaxID=1463898 RepID=UPI00069BD350|nr:ATP-grasp domain-containing protein [Streptomyces sp. NRRL S-31]
MALIVGVGGLPAPDALRVALTVTPRVSVLFITAWTDPAAVRTMWEQHRAAGLGAEFLAVPDLDGAVAAGLGLHERQPLTGVVTYSEVLLQPQARLVERLGLPGNGVEAVSVAQSKARQRAVFAAHGVPAPRFAEILGEDDIERAVAEVGMPAVLKPSLGAGSQNVRKVRTVGEVVEAYRAARASKTAFLQHDEVFLLEEALPVEGAEDSPYADYVSVETLLVEGKPDHLAVSDRLRLRHGYVEEGLVLPSRLPAERTAEIVDCAEQAIRATGLTHGAVHTEIALTPEGPKVIEVNARAGGPIPKMLLAAADYDFAGDIARVALGQAPGPGPRFSGVAWFRFLPIPAGEWRVVSQRTAEETRREFPELTQLSLRFKPGQTASRNSTQHLASFTVRGATPEQARRISAAVERFLAIDLQPASQGQTTEEGR